MSSHISNILAKDLIDKEIEGIVIDDPLAHYIAALECDIVLAGDEIFPFYYNWVFKKKFKEEEIKEIMVAVY